MKPEQQLVINIMADHGGHLTVPWFLWNDATLAELLAAHLIRCVPASCPNVTLEYELTTKGLRRPRWKFLASMH